MERVVGMTNFPRLLVEIGEGELRAGGTDLMERRKSGVASGPVVDIRDVPDLESIVDGRIGAKVRIADLGRDPGVRVGWKGVAEAAASLATPQIREVATVGGNLCQRPRCWYFRDPASNCLKKGGTTCMAREGDHLFHACLDSGGCVAVHASTLACALLAYDAGVEVFRPPGLKPTRNARPDVRTIAEFLGDGADATRENTLERGEVVAHVVLPNAVPDEKSSYFRAIHRARAEWPLAEVVVRLGSAGSRVAVGGVANVPLRLHSVEAALDAGEPWEKAASRAKEGARPLPMTYYKVDIMVGAILCALEVAS